MVLDTGTNANQPVAEVVDTVADLDQPWGEVPPWPTESATENGISDEIRHLVNLTLDEEAEAITASLPPVVYRDPADVYDEDWRRYAEDPDLNATTVAILDEMYRDFDEQIVHAMEYADYQDDGVHAELGGEIAQLESRFQSDIDALDRIMEGETEYLEGQVAVLRDQIFDVDDKAEGHEKRITMLERRIENADRTILNAYDLLVARERKLDELEDVVGVLRQRVRDLEDTDDQRREMLTNAVDAMGAQVGRVLSHFMKATTEVEDLAGTIDDQQAAHGDALQRAWEELNLQKTLIDTAHRQIDYLTRGQGDINTRLNDLSDEVSEIDHTVSAVVCG